jgi:hypothetical protein
MSTQAEAAVVCQSYLGLLSIHSGELVQTVGWEPRVIVCLSVREFSSVQWKHGVNGGVETRVEAQE